MTSTGSSSWSLNSRGYLYESIESFSWKDYLEAEGSVSAPACCFKQAEQPPVNEFKPDMKLESKDPRNRESMCIATVIECIGPRLRLRLDGSDNKNDFWCLVDSTDIRPFGWTNRHNGLLQPPLGFIKNASMWPSFLSKILANSNMAHQSYFKPEPPTPKQNLFEMHMKLEAVDRKNPHLICPATIGGIDGERIFIRYDGWGGTVDYWVHHASRDIFPVGWCAKAGHPLQPPGQKGVPQMKQDVSAKSNADSDVVETRQMDEDGGKKASSSTFSVPEQILSGSAAPLSIEYSQIRLYVNSNCCCGPHIDPTLLGALSENVIIGPVMDALSKVVQMLVSCASEPEKVMSKMVPGQSRYLITAKIKDVTQPFNTKITQTCRLPIMTGLMEVNIYISKLLSSLLCCPNMITLKPLTRPCQCKSGCAALDNLKRGGSTSHSSIPCKRGRPKKMKPSLMSPASSTYQANCDSSAPKPVQSQPAPSPQPLPPPSMQRAAAQPAVVQPAAAQPAAGQPAVAQPAVVQPSAALPAVAKPAVVQPSAALPAVAKPAAIQPLVQHAIAQPAAVQPSAVKPVAAQPLAVKPASAKPLAVQPAVAQPAAVQPAAAQPAAVQPAAAQPAAAQPAAASHESALPRQKIQLRTHSGQPPLPVDPCEWTCEDVMNYIGAMDDSLKAYVGLIKYHEIDGRAFMLMNSDIVMKYMNIKLGPALKMCDLIERLKVLRGPM